ncbi:MAG TPA: SagB/ThcOx family dehydrogenase [Vicinamibacteria bacterium]|nr:SagB/ThcOx family dehydrogenase [Vicinamibacteria bacterium]
MANDDTDEAWRYHDQTKHSYESVRRPARPLDWANEPALFKRYLRLPEIDLPRELPRFGVPALAAISATIPPLAPRPLDLPTLAHLLFFSAGVTKRRRFPGGEVAFRAAACTGARYEIELYVACREVGGLEPGLYHFDPERFALRPLRRGDVTGVLVRATAAAPSVAHAAATIVCTGTYWRNAWKYRARTYRHFGWDNGTILANLLAAAAAAELPARVLCGFVDGDVNELLGLEVKREVSLALVPVGNVERAAAEAAPLPPLRYEVEPYSKREVDYPEMRRLHAASSLAGPEEVAAWRAAAEPPPEREARPVTGRFFPLAESAREVLPADTLEDVILRRGSARRFARGAAWTFDQLSKALFRALQPIPSDVLGGLNDLYLIVHAVEGVPAGAYAVHRQPAGIELLKEGVFRDEAGYLGLEQDLPADASAVVFFLADLDAVLARLGNRGYRAANLEAGLVGGRLYLAAYAQRLGASGLTFYDDDVVRFFLPQAAGTSAVFCVALGLADQRT